jgi:hypothetical protein
MEKMYNPFFEGTEREDEEVDVLYYFEKKFNMEYDQRQRLAINILVHIAKTKNQEMINYLKYILTSDQYGIIKHQYLSNFDVETNKFKDNIAYVAEKQYIGETITALFKISEHAATFAQLR